MLRPYVTNKSTTNIPYKHTDKQMLAGSPSVQIQTTQYLTHNSGVPIYFIMGYNGWTDLFLLPDIISSVSGIPAAVQVVMIKTVINKEVPSLLVSKDIKTNIRSS